MWLLLALNIFTCTLNFLANSLRLQLYRPLAIVPTPFTCLRFAPSWRRLINKKIFFKVSDLVKWYPCLLNVVLYHLYQSFITSRWVFFCNRRRKLEKELLKSIWQININELTYIKHTNRAVSRVSC